MDKDGINYGAMSKEFLAQAIFDMGNILFASRNPCQSTYNVQNGLFPVSGRPTTLFSGQMCL